MRQRPGRITSRILANEMPGAGSPAFFQNVDSMLRGSIWDERLLGRTGWANFGKLSHENPIGLPLLFRETLTNSYPRYPLKNSNWRPRETSSKSTVLNSPLPILLRQGDDTETEAPASDGSTPN